jgi:hypothetical protein
MNSASKGNDPERWGKLLEVLDDKLQLSLLEHLKKVSSYHFEEDILYIEPGSPDIEKYFQKDSAIQQLQLLAQDAIGIEKVKIKKPR